MDTASYCRHDIRKLNKHQIRSVIPSWIISQNQTIQRTSLIKVISVHSMQRQIICFFFFAFFHTGQ